MQEVHQGSAPGAPEQDPLNKNQLNEWSEPGKPASDLATANTNGVHYADAKTRKRRAPKAAPDTLPGFDAFWEAYPRKVDKQDALKAWAKLAPDADLVETILAALERQKRWDQWQRDDGQYVPYPPTWLTKRRWEAQGPAAAGPSAESPADKAARIVCERGEAEREEREARERGGLAPVAEILRASRGIKK